MSPLSHLTNRHRHNCCHKIDTLKWSYARRLDVSSVIGRQQGDPEKSAQL